MKLSGTVCDGSEAATFNGIDIADNVNFYAPMVLGPGNPNTWYYGSDKLYRSTDRADTAVAVSQLFDQQPPPVGGTPPPPTAISAIAISPQDDNVRIVGLNNGEIFATTTGSPVLVQIAGPLATNGPTNTPATANVTSGAAIGVGRIQIDPNKKNIAYVAYTGFGTPAAPISHVYKITNLSNLPSGNVTVTPAATGLPDIPHNAIAIDPQTSSNGASTDIYVGTDNGVYRSRDGGATWRAYGTGFPHVSVFGLEIQNTSRTLRAATHGRGMYETPAGTPDVVKAVSRKTHGTSPANTFDIDLPLVGPSGIECRSGGANGAYTVVFTFDGNISAVDSVSVAGAENITSSGAVGPNPNQYTVNLSGVPNARTVTITLNGVHEPLGTTLAAASANLGVLIGDVDASRQVDGNDVLAVQTKTRQRANNTNFMLDVNTTGLIDGNDVSITQSKTRTSLP